MDSIEFYDGDPGGYSEKTFHADISELRDAFTSLLPDGASVLDLGCGSGRDTIAFSEMGFMVTAADGSEGMCRIAESNTGIRPRRMLFSEMDYIGEFDGVWACSSLLHVPSADLPHTFSLIRRALIEGGIAYVSFKEGSFEGIRDGRHYTDMTVTGLGTLASQSGFDIVRIWESLEPERDVAWVNGILRKASDR